MYQVSFHLDTMYYKCILQQRRKRFTSWNTFFSFSWGRKPFFYGWKGVKLKQGVQYIWGKNVNLSMGTESALFCID